MCPPVPPPARTMLSGRAHRDSRTARCAGGATGGGGRALATARRPHRGWPPRGAGGGSGAGRSRAGPARAHDRRPLPTTGRADGRSSGRRRGRTGSTACSGTGRKMRARRPRSRARSASMAAGSDAGEPGEQPDDEEREDQRRAARGDQRELHAGDRQQADDVAHVHGRLADDPDGDRHAGELDEAVGRAAGDAEAGVGEHAVQGDDDEAAEETELLADDREDVVGLRVRQQVPLHRAVAEPDAPQAAGGQGVHAADGLEAAVGRDRRTGRGTR